MIIFFEDIATVTSCSELLSLGKSQYFTGIYVITSFILASKISIPSHFGTFSTFVSYFSFG
jgi:hypothetical protein